MEAPCLLSLCTASSLSLSLARALSCIACHPCSRRYKEARLGPPSLPHSHSHEAIGARSKLNFASAVSDTAKDVSFSHGCLSPNETPSKCTPLIRYSMASHSSLCSRGGACALCHQASRPSCSRPPRAAGTQRPLYSLCQLASLFPWRREP